MTRAGPPRSAAAPALVVLNLLACSVGWASGFLFIKLGNVGVAPPAIAAMRGLVAAAVFAAMSLAQGRSLRPHGREWRDWAVLGAVNGWGPNMLVAFALGEIGAGPAAMIQASSPLIVAAMAHGLFADERLGPRRLLGLLLGFAGIAVLIGPDAFSGLRLSGALAMLGVAVSYAVGNVYVRSIPEAEPLRLALGQQLFSGPPAAVIALATLGPSAFAGVPGNAPALLALGLVGTALPNLLFMRLIRRAGPTRAATVGYLVPVWAALLAFAFLGETVGAREVVGGLVVLAGVAVVSTARPVRP